MYLPRGWRMAQQLTQMVDRMALFDDEQSRDGDLVNKAVIGPDANCLRQKLDSLLRRRTFEMVIGAVIMFNLVLVILETDHETAATASGEDPSGRFAPFNSALLIVYVVELGAKLYTYRLNFFREYWNNLDFFIVALDLVFLFFGQWLEAPSLNFLRIFRLARLLRAFRMASLFPELNLLLKGFFGAVRAIFWGVLMVCLLLSVWSILAVKLIHPINLRVAEKGLYYGCDRCADSFSTVWKSSLTFFQQVVAGDSWGTVSLPIIDEEWWTAFFFLAVLVSVSLAMLNLILAVICEAATEARQQSIHDKAEEHQRQMQLHRQRILDLCGEMDDDKSGSVSFAELIAGWDASKEFADTLTAMDIKKDDMRMIFNVLDTDGSGDVRYEEFVDQLHMLKTNETRLILFTVMGIRCQVEERFKLLQSMLPPCHLNESHEAQAEHAVPDAVDAPKANGAISSLGQQPCQQNSVVTEALPVCGNATGALKTQPAPETKNLAQQVADNICLGVSTEELDRLIKSNEELVRAVKGLPPMTELGEQFVCHGNAEGTRLQAHVECGALHHERLAGGRADSRKDKDFVKQGGGANCRGLSPGCVSLPL